MKNKKVIIFATGNYGKLNEVKTMLNSEDIEVKCLKDFPPIIEPEETGKTFFENASIKAKYYYDYLKCPVLCDDSGLVVDALNGEPGVHSARYAGIDENRDFENIKKLLSNLKGVNNRNAQFNCTMVYYNGSEYFTTEGILEGRIIDIPKGNNGFGYDPIFVPNGSIQTLAELNQNQKNEISHRHNALIKMVDILKSH